MRRILITVGPKGTDPSGMDESDGFLEGADEVILAPSDSIVAKPPANDADVADLYAALRPRLPRLFLARCELDAMEHVCRSWQTGEATACVRLDGVSRVVLSEGMENPLGRLLPELPPERRHWIGQGSNTWKSDLNLAVRYCRTSGPADASGASLGIPWMAGIPGTVGGWIKMNAGAFGHSISEMLEAVCVDGEWRPAAACGFAYRHSEITGEIQDFRLRSPDALKAEASADDYRRRRRRFPAGTFGSFFKNPPGDFAGRLLEATGAKSLRVGGASVWKEHANVIVREPSATASDVLALARLMQARVNAAFGIRLEPEVCGLFRPIGLPVPGRRRETS